MDPELLSQAHVSDRLRTRTEDKRTMDSAKRPSFVFCPRSFVLKTSDSQNPGLFWAGEWGIIVSVLPPQGRGNRSLTSVGAAKTHHRAEVTGGTRCRASAYGRGQNLGETAREGRNLLRP